MRRRLAPSANRRERRCRNAIEPVIGHMKDDGHLGRFLLGAAGDATNLILAAAGHNLRLLRAWLAWLLAFLVSLLLASHQSRPARQARAPAA